MGLPSFKYGCPANTFKVMDDLMWHNFKITRKTREKDLSQHAKCVFLTGLSGSGKSTVANGLEVFLHNNHFCTYILDGDNIRMGINSDLGFSPEDRTENLRRIAEVAKLFVDAGIILICSFIAPTKKDREMIKSIVGADDFIEVYVKASVDTCIKRDPKGLYKKALNGEIKDFTGTSALYEIPENPYHVVDTENDDLDECVSKLAQSLIVKLR